MLAGMAMLAHAVIPHHYHYSDKFTICFLVVHCSWDVYQDNKETYGRPDGSGDTRRNGSDGTEECPLKKVYVKAVGDRLLVASNPDSDIRHPALFSFSIDPVVEIAGLQGLPFRQKPLPYHTDHIADASGLRAPPTFN